MNNETFQEKLTLAAKELAEHFGLEKETKDDYDDFCLMYTSKSNKDSIKLYISPQSKLANLDYVFCRGEHTYGGDYYFELKDEWTFRNSDVWVDYNEIDEPSNEFQDVFNQYLEKHFGKKFAPSSLKFGVSAKEYADFSRDVLLFLLNDKPKELDEWLKRLPQTWSDRVCECLIDVIPYIWLRFDKGFSTYIDKDDGSQATDMDTDIEDYLKYYFQNGIEWPEWLNCDFVLEETGQDFSTAERYICIDPVDGTHNMENYQKETFPNFFSSIAFVENGKTIFSILTNPCATYFSFEGAGVVKIDRKLNCSLIEKPQIKSVFPLVAVSGADVKEALEVANVETRHFRVTGSTVLDIFNCGLGFYQSCFCHYVHEWDWRGASLFATELGCQMEVKKVKDMYEVKIWREQ